MERPFVRGHSNHPHPHKQPRHHQHQHQAARTCPRPYESVLLLAEADVVAMLIAGTLGPGTPYSALPQYSVKRTATSTSSTTTITTKLAPSSSSPSLVGSGSQIPSGSTTFQQSSSMVVGQTASNAAPVLREEKEDGDKDKQTGMGAGASSYQQHIHPSLMAFLSTVSPVKTMVEVAAALEMPLREVPHPIVCC